MFDAERLKEIIALLYLERWTIEIFFRFFKHLLGCRHLLSHKQNGIEIQTYCAIITCMLISLWTGRKPTKRTYEMICFYFCGLASEDELLVRLTATASRPRRVILTVDFRFSQLRPHFEHISANVVPNSIGAG